MKHDKIWGYLIHLNENMWPAGDRDAMLAKGWTEQQFYDYSEKIRIDWDLNTKLMEFLPSQGFNTVVVDVGNAVQYERHPEISMKEALTKDQLKAFCDQLRALGLTPIPKLNFSCGHDSWLKEYSKMIGTEAHRQACDDCIDEVAEIFGWPEYFHLGQDEDAFRNQAAYSYQHTRAPHILWADRYRLFDRCAHNNARPWVWADEIWNDKRYGQELYTKMPKSVLLSNWWYSPDTGKKADGSFLEDEFQGYIWLNEHGFDQVLTCSTWQNETNTEFTFRLAKERLDPAHFKGVLTAPWDYCYGHHFYPLMQEAVRFGLAKKKIYPEEN